MVLFRSIQAKVVSIIIFVLALTIAASIYITATNQRTNLLDETRQNLSVTSEVLNNVVRNIMLAGEAPITQSTLADLKAIEKFTDISIFRTDGTSAFHDDSTIKLVNAYQESVEFSVTERSPLTRLDSPYLDQVLEKNTSVYVETPDARKAEYFFPIINFAECTACHGYAGSIVGVAHYEASTEGIYNRIATARNTLLIFFLATGTFLAALLIILLRQTVLKPLLTIGKTVNEVSEGNLDAKIKLKAKDELGTLARELNNMIEGLKEKSRLEIQNRVIDARNQENRKYLDNISEGLLLLDRKKLISDQYSLFLETLFATEDIKGRIFSEFIYPSDDEESERRKEIDQFVELVFSSLNTEMEMLDSINPLKDKTLIIERDGINQEIVIDTEFQRIMTDDEVQNVMVIFIDKTDLVRIERELQSEKIKSETEIEHIAAILRTGPQSFLEFTQDADKALSLLDQNLDLSKGKALINELFRGLHSLKGASRYMELKSFANTLHETEDIVAAVRDGSRPADAESIRELSLKLNQLRDENENIKKINDRFKEFASQDTAQQQFSLSVQGLFDNIERMTMDIAEELGKKIMVKTTTEFDRMPHLQELRDPIIHIIRNSVDHGIEEEIERISKGKDETGTIAIKFARAEDDSFLIDIQDDGRGIDFEAVKKRAVESGMMPSGEAEMTQAQLVQILFTPAFSSRSKVTEFSGRGVGLDVVQSTIKKLGGSISLATKKDRGTKFSLKIPLSAED